MVLRQLLQMFANHPHIIEKLSESYPMRRAAQMTVYLYLKGKRLRDDALQDVVKEGGQRFQSFSSTFKEELKKGWEEAEAKRKR